MPNMQFKDLGVDAVFTLNNVQYKKVAEQRVSCCKSINAVKVDDAKIRVKVEASTEVQVND